MLTFVFCDDCGDDAYVYSMILSNYPSFALVSDPVDRQYESSLYNDSITVRINIWLR